MRNLSRVGIKRLEQKGYSEKTLQEFGIRNERTLLAMAQFKMLVAGEEPYPVASTPKKPEK